MPNPSGTICPRVAPPRRVPLISGERKGEVEEGFVKMELGREEGGS